jgi:hypothetical protein
MSRTISLSLEPAESTIKKGVPPRFQLTLRNEGRQDERVIDLSNGRRRDLQHTYYDLEVTQEGKPVNLPRAISDPGPVMDDDYLLLKPGAMVTFELSRFPFELEWLPRGRYQARVRFWQNPSQSYTTSFYSPAVEVVVP